MPNPIHTQLITLQATPVSPPPELDVWKVIMDATAVGQAVLIVLVMMSLISWFIVGAKTVRLLQAKRQTQKFLEIFWTEGQRWSVEAIEAIYAQLKGCDGSPVAKVFRAGYVELARLSAMEDALSDDATLDNVERALRRASVAEMTGLESMLTFLATTGSTAPFIGLFGTVWGIMSSFLAISGMESASIQVVAPGIAEALIATAIGLAAAIPAVVAYNYLVRRINVLESEMDTFSSDYLNIVKRHFL